MTTAPAGTSRTTTDPAPTGEPSPMLTAHSLRRLRRLRLGSGVLGGGATSCLHRIATEIARLDAVVHELDERPAELVAPNGTPLEDVCDAGPQVTTSLIAQSGEGHRFRDREAYARCGGVAQGPCGSGASSGRHRLHRGSNSQVHPLTASLLPKRRGIQPPRRSWSADWPRAIRPARHDEHSSGTLRTAPIAGSTNGRRTRFRSHPLDIGALSGPWGATA
jgi:hypothetical protein